MSMRLSGQTCTALSSKNRLREWIYAEDAYVYVHTCVGLGLVG